MEEQDVKLKTKPGIVILDDTYGFKVCDDCYVFGKVNDKGDISNPLYPSTIESVFRLYSKQKLAEITADKRLSISDLLEAINQVKSIILEVKNKLEIGA